MALGIFTDMDAKPSANPAPPKSSAFASAHSNGHFKILEAKVQLLEAQMQLLDEKMSDMNKKLEFIARKTLGTRQNRN